MPMLHPPSLHTTANFVLTFPSVYYGYQPLPAAMQHSWQDHSTFFIPAYINQFEFEPEPAITGRARIPEFSRTGHNRPQNFELYHPPKTGFVLLLF